ncbi:TPA: aspartate aminotransferase family protein [Candidatus Dependentiae bacterium]|nr:MAG: Aminotransferase [candidate division TM6 bacterium GW2011_GWE2_31_21]KKP53917.1 MAG: Aminotransferase [candidate division TM6 bacterium GW2011_GWF2_33_332]HBS47697.1 aspartate aminotransferase family protein [Candidatus Dependentiae bacterium]HBZ73846.1 aspartate aminotransferase family protein [Candidatus Dependentiae bacterium]
MLNRYSNSEKMLERALKTVPLGSQTYSKSKVHFPYGVSPFFIDRGEGCYVWDVDGNKYIDFGASLGAIVLGYGDEDLSKAVRKQLEKGTIFPLANEIEFKVAEKIVELVPCAEKVRFGKNGSDVTTAAIRLARAYTKKDHIVMCGYHGWHDWSIGTTSRNLGVPEVVKELTHTFKYNDINSLKTVFQQYPNQIAAVILEPMSIEYPKDDFLQKVKEVAHENGAILIFDEMITGFRYSLGGAQKLFGVVPDLATFGKALANGFPVSAIAGKSEIMNLMEEIFFSFTFGGETLSLAAALATMTKLQSLSILEDIKEKGQTFLIKLNELFLRHELSEVFSVSGHPSWSILQIKDFKGYSSFQIRTLFLQEMFKRNILFIGAHFFTHSHSESDINALLIAYDEVLILIKNCLSAKTLDLFLECEPLKPLFKVR